MVFAELANFVKFWWKCQWDFGYIFFGVTGFLFGLLVTISFII